MVDKYSPSISEHLYLRQSTGDCWVDEVKRPYTVIDYDGQFCKVQACRLIFNGPAYYDTIADDIVEDPDGRIVTLKWNKKKGRWQDKDDVTGYPMFAVFGEWKHQPYLN